MSTRTYSVPAKNVTARKILSAGLASILAAILANLAARAILFSVLELPTDFPPFGFFSIIFFTTLGTGLGVLVFALINRRSRMPIRAYMLVATVALIVSLIPNFALLANPAAAPLPGGTAMNFGVLIVFHIVAAIVHLGVFLPMLAD